MKFQLLSLVLLVGYCSAANLVCPQQFDPQRPTFFPHPVCTKYYVCNWQTVVEQNCPAGLHWNQRASYCDYPQKAGCVGAPAVSSTTTPSAPTAPTAANPSGQCPLVYDPKHQVYFPHTDCSKYYICTFEGTKLEQNCPQGLHWSRTNNYCDYPDRAKCKGVARTWIQGAVPEQVTPNLRSMKCPSGANKDVPVFVSHESDCTKYYVCDNGRPIPMNCPAGLFWNARETTCDIPSQSGCIQRVLL